MPAIQAIKLSVETEAVVDIPYRASVADALYALADGFRIDDAGVEYWGEYDGSLWRVRLTGYEREASC
jgi:hypothetical protein